MSKLLQVNDLTTEFTGDFGKKISVDHVSFDVAEGETVCIVGESGCGKSVTSLSIMGLLGRGGAVVDGSVLFANKNLLDMDEKQLDTIRGNQMTMIFQDPLTSLNPVFTIGSQITESIRIHMHLSKKEAGERAVTILEKVGMPDARAHSDNNGVINSATSSPNNTIKLTNASTMNSTIYKNNLSNYINEKKSYDDYYVELSLDGDCLAYYINSWLSDGMSNIVDLPGGSRLSSLSLDYDF